jgi:hypothetical protein
MARWPEMIELASVDDIRGRFRRGSTRRFDYAWVPAFPSQARSWVMYPELLAWIASLLNGIDGTFSRKLPMQGFFRQ